MRGLESQCWWGSAPLCLGLFSSPDQGPPCGPAGPLGILDADLDLLTSDLITTIDKLGEHRGPSCCPGSVSQPMPVPSDRHRACGALGPRVSAISLRGFF